MKPDYIIVGAGSAGCVLANRLSANPQINVVLLEAGGNDTKMEIHIPAAYAKLHHSSVNWNFNTEPQKHVNNRKIIPAPRQNAGGNSSVNCMAYIRGNKEDYNDWERLGNKGGTMKPCCRISKNRKTTSNLKTTTTPAADC